MVSSDSDDRLSVEIRGNDLKTAELLMQQVNTIMRNVRGVTDTRISREVGRPEEIIRINRYKAADLGLSVARIGEILETALGGTYSSNYREGGKEYRILTRLREEDRHNLDNLLDLTVVNNRGVPVQLRNVVDVLPAMGPVSIERKDQERIITVSGDYSGRDLGSIVRELLLGVILAIILTYMVMAGQFESLRDPLVIMFSVPMALIGVMLVMILTGTTFSINALIGCIMLAGIVVNNAILLVDYANLVRRRDGLELFDAVRAAGARRLRPILMTSLTTILGLLPLSLGLGAGGETQAPLARVVIGGLSSSTLVTLILIPVIYTLFEQKLKGQRIKSTDQEIREPVL
jgi:HAE1 family hydrophobic/amphiphilic exporter-1